MRKIDKLISIAKRKANGKLDLNEREVYEKMTIHQLKEIVYGNPTDERIQEIFSSVDGLHLLE